MPEHKKNYDYLCIYCGAPSKYLCVTCKSNYCSPDCQDEDWYNGNHKSICHIDVPGVVLRKSSASSSIKESTEIITDMKKPIVRGIYTPEINVALKGIVQHFDEGNPKILHITEQKHLKKLADLIGDASKLRKCNLNDICVDETVLVTRDETVHRAEILNIAKEKQLAKVRLVDNGSIIALKFSEFFVASETLKSMPSYLLRIELTKEPPKNMLIDSIASFKILCEKPNEKQIYLAELILPNTVASPTYRLPKFGTTELNKTPVIIVQKNKKGTRSLMRLGLDDAERNLKRIEEIFKTSPETINPEMPQPNAGDMVAAFTVNYGWQRAYLIYVSEIESLRYLVYLCDIGMNCFTQQIKVLPKELESVPLTTFVTVTRYTQPLENMDEDYFILESPFEGSDDSGHRDDNAKLGSLYTKKGKICEVKLVKYCAARNHLNMEYWKEMIPDTSKVYVLDILEPFKVTVSHCDTLQYPKLMTELARKCSVFEKMDSIDIGQVILVKNDSGQYLRAEVLSISSSSDLRIKNIDTWDEFTVSRHDEIRRGSEIISNIPVYITTINLSLLSDMKCSLLIEIFENKLTELKDNKNKFAINYKDRIENNAELLFPNDYSLSALLMELLIKQKMNGTNVKIDLTLSERNNLINKKSEKPDFIKDAVVEPKENSMQKSNQNEKKLIEVNSVKKDETRLVSNTTTTIIENREIYGLDSQRNNANGNENKRFMFSDIKVSEIPTGESVNVVVLDSSELLMEKHFTGGSGGVDSVGRFIIELQHNIEEHCQKAETDPNFDPIVGEVLMCRYKEDKGWYRAVVLEKSVASKKYKVKFFDYGNEDWVDHDSDILPMPEIFFKAPVKSHTCVVKGLSDQKLELLLEKLGANPLIKGRVEKGDGCYNLYVNF